MKKLKLYLNYFSFLLSFIVPKKRNRWVFGAWYGNRISDNSYAFYKYIQTNYPNIETIWICNDVSVAQNMGINAKKRNSWAAIWSCLTAKVAVMNQGFYDFGDLNWIKNSYKVQLWHGVPWKKIGEDTVDRKGGLLHKISHKTFLLASRYDLYISPSEETRKVLRSAFITDDRHILSVGQPRNEVLMDLQYCNNARKKLEVLYNAERIILFMPTFRDNTVESFSFTQIETDITPLLTEYNAVILEKQHYVTELRGKENKETNERIINVADWDTQELLAAVDVLITDYSSCFFDFILRDKPIIHYIYDYDIYKNKDRGLYYDADYVVAGTIAKTQDELIEQIKKVLTGASDDGERRQVIRDRFDTYESINNSRTIYNKIVEHIKS